MDEDDADDDDGDDDDHDDKDNCYLFFGFFNWIEGNYVRFAEPMFSFPMGHPLLGEFHVSGSFEQIQDSHWMGEPAKCSLLFLRPLIHVSTIVVSS